MWLYGRCSPVSDGGCAARWSGWAIWRWRWRCPRKQKSSSPIWPKQHLPPSLPTPHSPLPTPVSPASARKRPTGSPARGPSGSSALDRSSAGRSGLLAGFRRLGRRGRPRFLDAAELGQRLGDLDPADVFHHLQHRGQRSRHLVQPVGRARGPVLAVAAYLVVTNTI